jgi:hypothetical protein
MGVPHFFISIWQHLETLVPTLKHLVRCVKVDISAVGY